MAAIQNLHRSLANTSVEDMLLDKYGSVLGDGSDGGTAVLITAPEELEANKEEPGTGDMIADTNMSIVPHSRKMAADLPWRERAELFGLNENREVLGGTYQEDKTHGVLGGGIEEGESVEEGALRELLEESGYTGTNAHVLPVNPVETPWNPPYSSPSQEERAKRYRGSRTHFVGADIVPGGPGDVAEPSMLQDLQFRPLSDAIALTDLDKARYREMAQARRASLEHLLKSSSTLAQETATDLEKRALFPTPTDAFRKNASDTNMSIVPHSRKLAHVFSCCGREDCPGCPGNSMLVSREEFAKKAASIDDLLAAKKESDRRNYPAKHAILRNLIKASPGDFVIDSEVGNISGLTHIPTGFRIHLPRKEIPAGLKKKQVEEETQEAIFDRLKAHLPPEARHASGGMPDVSGLSDVDVSLHHADPSQVLALLPKGTTTRSQREDTGAIEYAVPGYSREVNVYATPDPDIAQRSVDHRRTEIELRDKFPDLYQSARALKGTGHGTEQAWAETLGIKDDPYAAMRDTGAMLAAATMLNKQAEEKRRFYHGSPTPNLVELQPRKDPRTGRTALFVDTMVHAPEIFSLMPARHAFSKDETTRGGKLIKGEIVGKLPLNDVGYVYTVEVDPESVVEREPGRFHLTAPAEVVDVHKVTKEEVLAKGWQVKGLEQEDDVYVHSAVPAAAMDLVRKHGLLSSEAILSNPAALAAVVAGRKGTDWEEDEATFTKRVQDKLKNSFWADAMKGPSVFFGEPDPEKITDVHPMRKLKSKSIRVNLSKLLHDYPKTRIAGSELQPYDPEGPEAQGHLRHYDIDLAKVREYAATDPKELWKHYDSPEGTRYASDVPHAQIITPSGSIAPEYLDFGDEDEIEKFAKEKQMDARALGIKAAFYYKAADPIPDVLERLTKIAALDGLYSFAANAIPQPPQQPYWQAGLIGQIKQPTWNNRASFFNNITTNLRQAKGRAAAKIRDQDFITSFRSDLEPGFAYRNIRRFLREGDYVKSPIDRALFRGSLWPGT